jgi:flagellar L-ring protein precursor FlgH
MNRKACAMVLAGLLLVPGVVEAQDKKGQQPAADTYEAQYSRYLEAARATRANGGSPIGWMAGLATDLRARQVNDLVTIRVVESIAAAGTADSSLDKSSNAGASVTHLFGAEGKLPGWIDPTSLVSASANTKFKGGGATSRSGDLSAIVTARVTEVLPNGDLVIESAREIDINGDRQMVVLSGVVRPADINRNNVALSTAVGQLRIRYFGHGLIKDNLTPGWLVRVLNRIF